MKTSFDSLEAVIAAAAEGLKPAERMTVSQAAAAYRKLENKGAYVGPWLNDMTPYLVEPMDELASREFTAEVFVGPAQCGKALALDTPIPTPSGWSTMGDIRLGDLVIGSDGFPVRVSGATEVMRDRKCYRVRFSNGEEVVADADHQWHVLDASNGYLVRVATTDFLKTRVGYGQLPRPRWAVPVVAPLDLPEIELPLDPYVLGAWLGDGHAYGARIYAHADDAEPMRQALGIPTRVHIDTKGLAVIALSAVRHNPGVAGRAGVSAALGALGLGAGEAKYIPSLYLRASYAQRMALLQGLMDTDGSASKKGHCEFSTSVAAMASGVEDLLTGLGYSWKRVQNGKAIRLMFAPRGDERIFRLDRKQKRLAGVQRRPRRQEQTLLVAIEEVASVPVRCIRVDSDDHLYAFGRRMVMTHNTDMFLNWLTYSVKCDPADMMLIEKAQATARDFSIRRVDRLHRQSEEVGARLIPRRDADNTFDKQYVGMLLNLSWPTINELSGRPIQRLWLTDYDRMPEDIDDEGSPFDQARKRATSFRSHGMTVAESSPGYTISDPKWERKSAHQAPTTGGILALYNRGDRRRWYWKCISCHHAFEPAFGLFRYPNSEDLMESAEQVVLVCPECGQVYSQHPGKDEGPGRYEMNRAGKWIKDGQVWMPDGSVAGVPVRSDIASFWLKGAAAAMVDWKTLVINYLKALQEYNDTGSEMALKTTVGVDQGEPYLPKSQEELRSPEDLKARARDLGERVVPFGGRFLIATVDVQKNRFVVQVHACGEGTDTWIVDRFEIKKSRRKDLDGDTLWVNPGAYPEDWKLLVTEVMEKTYPLADGSGRRMAIKETWCDSGGREGVTPNAYKFYIWLRRGDGDEAELRQDDDESYGWKPGLAARFRLLKGDPNENAPRARIGHPDSQRKDRHAGARGEIPVVMLNVEMLKDNLNTRLDRLDPLGGRINFPNWLSYNFFAELCVEVKDPKKGWDNPKGYRNESWDLLTYYLGAIHLLAVEYIDWAMPHQAWAKEWDDNELVFDPQAVNRPFEKKANRANSLSQLAAALA